MSQGAFDKSKARALAALMSRQWVSLAQLADIIDVSYHTILRMKRKGEIRAIKVGGMYRVYEDELERFLIQGNYITKEAIIGLMQLDEGN